MVRRLAFLFSKLKELVAHLVEHDDDPHDWKYNSVVVQCKGSILHQIVRPGSWIWLSLVAVAIDHPAGARVPAASWSRGVRLLQGFFAAVNLGKPFVQGMVLPHAQVRASSSRGQLTAEMGESHERSCRSTDATRGQESGRTERVKET
jgi:hypothetical protein